MSTQTNIWTDMMNRDGQRPDKELVYVLKHGERIVGQAGDYVPQEYTVVQNLSLPMSISMEVINPPMSPPPSKPPLTAFIQKCAQHFAEHIFVNF